MNNAMGGTVHRAMPSLPRQRVSRRTDNGPRRENFIAANPIKREVPVIAVSSSFAFDRECAAAVCSQRATDNSGASRFVPLEDCEGVDSSFHGNCYLVQGQKSWTSTVAASCTGRSLKLLWVDGLSTKNFRQGSLFTGHAITVRLPAPRRRRYFPSASHRGPAFSGRALLMRPSYPVPRPSPPPRVVSRPWRRHVSHPRHRSCVMAALVRRPRRCVQRRPRGHLLRTPHRRLAHPCSRAITMSCASTRARTTSRCARWRLPRLSLSAAL